MKKTILALSVVLICSAVAFAGDSTDHKHKMDSTEHKMKMKKDTTEHKHKMKKDTTETKAPETITTKSGLKYIDYLIGDGAEAKKGSQI